jgi:Flp pilus assembly protein TadD
MVSYAHEAAEGPAWKANVAELAALVRDAGYTVFLDQDHGDDHVDWHTFGPQHCRDADVVLSLASPEYKGAWEEAYAGTDNGDRNYGSFKETRAIVARQKAVGDHVPTWLVLDSRTAADVPADESHKNYVAVPSLTGEGVSGLLARLANEAQPVDTPTPTVGAQPDGEAGRASIPVVGALPPRLSTFVGRDPFLGRLGARTSGTSVISDVLHADGGVGKTELAVEYCYRRVDAADVSWIAWIVADSSTTLLDGLGRVAAHLGEAPLTDDEPASAFVERVRGAMERCGSSFVLVLDNVDAIDDVRRALPAVGQGQVLLATREANLAGRLGANGIELGVFTDEEALDAFKSRLGELVGDEELARLAKLVGNLPIGIDIVAGQLANGVPTDLIEQVLLQVPADRRGVTLDHLWQSSVDRLSDPARRLLHGFSVIDPVGIPIQHLGDVEFDPKLDSPELSLLDLGRWHLISLDGTSASIHRLLQASVRSALSKNFASPPTGVPSGVQAIADAAALIASVVPSDTSQRASWAKLERLDPHIRGLFDQTLVEEPRVTPDITRLVWRLGDRAATARQNSGNNHEALPRFEELVAFAERVIGVDHPDTITARANLAGSYRQAGRTDDATTIEEQVVTDYERVIGVDHPDTIRARANLAGSYRQAGRTDDATTIEEQVVTDYERVIGVDHPDTITARANLAGSYRQAGRTDDATTIEEQVVTDYERVIGVDHPDTIRARANLAGSYRQAGRTDDATTLLAAALADGERRIGAKHPVVTSWRKALTAWTQSQQV